MNWQAIGAIGELVGGLAVVLSLVYVGFQVRQNSRQIDQNSRQLEATMYHASGEGFNRWWSLIARDEAVADLWKRGLAGEELSPTDKLRFNSMAMMLFSTLENNFHQFQLGSLRRNTLEISKSSWERLLTSPGGSAWWEREARRSFTPEFVKTIETQLSVAESANPADATT
jgi:hypothetical protein